MFVDQVDVVTGVGPARARANGADRFQDLRRIVTDLAVLDFTGPDGAVALASLHPGVTLDRVVDATDFPLHIPTGVSETRLPTDEELRSCASDWTRAHSATER